MKWIVLVCNLFFFSTAFCQNKDLSKVASVADYSISEVLGTPNSIRINPHSKLSKVEPKKAISELLNVNQKDLTETQSTHIADDILIKRYKRFHNGIEVAHGNYTAIVKNGEITTIHSEHYDQISIEKSARLSKEKALTIALKQMQSDLYAWEATENLLKSKSLNSHQRKALKKAKEEDYPTGELVYVKDYYNGSKKLELAYLYIIESLSPEFRDKVYVSASDGRILLRDPQLKHGQGDTRYSGRQTFPTTRITIDTFELKGTEPVSGIFCETRSLEGLGGTPVSTPAIIALSEPVRDGDETNDPCALDEGEVIGEIANDHWDEAEHRKARLDGILRNCCPVYNPAIGCSEVENDDIALDAQWGAAMVARYWKSIHDRNGYDDQGASLLSFVHHGEAYENASWNGLYMKYGDGAYQDGNNPAGMFAPLVSLDVCAHEIGHAICTSTSDLVYVGESGAMNEGFSDIWAACIEQFVIDFITGTYEYLRWGIGEQIDERDSGNFNSASARALRWMDHPPAENNPDTYGAGTWWQDPDCASPSVANDFCGVHFNSGVLNKWFYLLTEGSGQNMSPGLNKPAADDEINDKSDVYSVNGIGIRKAEKITYGAELLLMPNSRFADMRAASIDIARSLYGPCSNEVEQTIRAWYAVGVGGNFGVCDATIEFNQFNTLLVNENSGYVGCGAQKTIALGVHSYMTNDTVNFTTTGNAEEGVDYEICTPTLSFIGDEAKDFEIIIFDDAVEESDDTIIIHLSGGGHSDTDTVIIVNDDGIPAIGISATLFSEDFNTEDGSWKEELVNPASMINEWYIDASNSNEAYVSWAGSSNMATYYQLIDSDVRLISPKIDAIGWKNINIAFKYEAGGERDLVATDALFDYGTFQISFNGFDWTDIDYYVGTAQSGGQVTLNGVYDSTHQDLSNKTFYLGFAWHNDALNGGSFSFMVDSIRVIGEGLEIETDSSAQMMTTVPVNERIAFISDQNEMIGIVEDSKAALGCTELLIADNDTLMDIVSSTCYMRGSKVYNLIDENSTDSLTLTLFYKESEIDEWPDPLVLNILTVGNTDIDQENNGSTIIDNSQVQINDARENGNGYVSYTFSTTSAYQSFALTNRPSTPQNMMVMNNEDMGDESLRGILEGACPNDTIMFSAVSLMDTFQVNTCDMDIQKNLVIIGNGVDETILSGNGLHQMFNVPEHANIKFESLRIIDNNKPMEIDTTCHNGSIELLNVEIIGN